MRFMSVRDLRNQSGEVWKKLKKDKEIVITSRGKPVALLTEVKEENLEEYILTLKKVKAFIAMEKMQRKSLKYGLDKWSKEEIEREIQAVRKERK